MQYTNLGATGLKVSRICLGMMSYGDPGWRPWVLDGGQARPFVQRALELGINFFDTADMYSLGVSEQVTGALLREMARRDDVVVATKVYFPMSDAPNDRGLSRKHIIASCEASLRRLGTDHIDLYQIHGFDQVTPMEETLRALDDLVHAGKVRYIGCSNLAAWQLMKSLWLSDKYNLYRFESLQAYYTIAGRDLERDIVPVLQDQSLGLMVWSPLAGGLLSGKFDREGKGPAGARRVDFDFPPVSRERAFNSVDAMREIAREKNVSVARIALAWLLHQPVVTSVIIGAKTPEQLADNLAASDVTLSDADLDRLQKVSELPAEYPGWMIAQQSMNRFPETPSDT